MKTVIVARISRSFAVEGNETGGGRERARALTVADKFRSVSVRHAEKRGRPFVVLRWYNCFTVSLSHLRKPRSRRAAPRGGIYVGRPRRFLCRSHRARGRKRHRPPGRIYARGEGIHPSGRPSSLPFNPLPISIPPVVNVLRYATLPELSAEAGNDSDVLGPTAGPYE